MDDIAFALVLNPHQPAGNLEDLLSNDPWAATEILWALDRTQDDVGVQGAGGGIPAGRAGSNCRQVGPERRGTRSTPAGPGVSPAAGTPLPERLRPTARPHLKR